MGWLSDLKDTFCAKGAWLTKAEVEACIPEPPDPVVIPGLAVERCAGPFVRESARTGWWAGWSPIITANQATETLIEWRDVGGPVVSPDCVTDLVFMADIGNHYLRVNRARAYVWVDIRLLVNGAPVLTRTNDKYRYLDGRNDTNPDVIPSVPVNMEPWGSANGGRFNIPAGATVQVQAQVRWNINAVQTSAWVRYIGGLRSQTIFTFQPRQEVTDVSYV